MMKSIPADQPNFAFQHKKVLCHDTKQAVVITYRISDSAFAPAAKMVTHLECFGQNICPYFCKVNLCTTLNAFQKKVLAEKDVN